MHGIIVGLILGVLIAIFAFLNTEVVTVNYFFGLVEASVAIIVVGSAFMGALAVGLVGLFNQIRTGFSTWDYRNKVQRLSREVEELKEQKRALADDLSFVNAECEQVLRKKDAELEECEEEASKEHEAECKKTQNEPGHTTNEESTEKPEEKESDAQ